jgi:hypothetical protein
MMARVLVEEGMNDQRELSALDNMIVCLHYLSKQAEADKLDKVAVILDQALKVAIADASMAYRRGK